jgi:hypothetical protein
LINHQCNVALRIIGLQAPHHGDSGIAGFPHAEHELEARVGLAAESGQVVVQPWLSAA